MHHWLCRNPRLPPGKSPHSTSPSFRNPPAIRPPLRKPPAQRAPPLQRPSAPVIKAVALTGRSATITVVSEGNVRPTGFNVQAVPLGGGKSITVTGAGPDLVLTGLQEGVSYVISAVARNAAGLGNLSKASRLKVPR